MTAATRPGRPKVCAAAEEAFIVDLRMNVAQLPFNRLIGLEREDPDGGCLVSLPEGPQYTNHLGTVHASALLAVAEAGSAEFLLRGLGDATGYVPVVRRVEAKFRKPASGRVAARAAVRADEVTRWSAELTTRGRVLATVAVDVVDSYGVIVLSALVEWFIARGDQDAARDAGSS
jgi:acyl-coenzyme A thioesterase PaaI-like protein